MSWSRRVLLGAALAASAPLALALPGCGFRPLYGDRGADPGAVELAAVAVGPIADRLGQILRNDLTARLSPLGEPLQPRYRLKARLRQSSSSLAIQSDSSITRFDLRIDVSFTLIEIASGRALFQGKARAIGGYDAVQSDFATLTAEQDSARRTVREAADDIRTQLAVFFARRVAGE